MKRIAIATILLAGTSLVLADSYVDNKKTLTHDCDKTPEAAVMGNDNTITFTGACSKITVTGNGNSLTVRVVKDVSVTGNHNKLNIDAPVNIAVTGNDNGVEYRATDDKKPAITNTGKNNKIIRDLVQPVKIEKTK